MDQDVTDKNRTQNTHAWRRTLQGGKTGKLGGIWMGLTRVEKVMVLDWGQFEMAVNSCLEDL